MSQRVVRIWVMPRRYCQWSALSWNSGSLCFLTVSLARVKPNAIVVMPPKTS